MEVDGERLFVDKEVVEQLCMAFCRGPSEKKIGMAIPKEERKIYGKISCLSKAEYKIEDL